MLANNLPISFDAQIISEQLEDKSYKLQFFSPNEHRPGVGGIYRDQEETKWLLKPCPAYYALKEVIASKIYHLLVKPNESAQVELFKYQDNWFVASKWQENLQSLTNEKICLNGSDISLASLEGIYRMFVASWIVGDKDCVSKNMAILQSHIFRYDFGATFDINDLSIEQIYTFYELISDVGFHSFLLSKNLQVDMLKQEINNINSLDFNWGYWQDLLAYHATQQNMANIDIKTFISNRIEVLQKMLILENVTYKVEKRFLNLHQSLVDFYTIACQELQPFFPENYSSLMATLHIESLVENKKNLIIFDKLLNKANSSINLNNILKTLGNSHENKNSEIIFFENLLESVKKVNDFIKTEFNIEQDNFHKISINLSSIKEMNVHVIPSPVSQVGIFAGKKEKDEKRGKSSDFSCNIM